MATITIMCAECDFEFEIYKAKADYNGDVQWRINPCPKCVKEAEESGYQSGKEEE
mgnify:FL=1